MNQIVRQVVIAGTEERRVAAQLVEQLCAPDLKLVLVFANYKLDQSALAAALHGLRAPVVGCSALGVIGPRAPLEGMATAAIGFYGDWLRVGIGIAPDLPKSALSRSRDAVIRAASALELTPEQLDPSTHVAITLIDGTCGHEEAFCIGSAVTAPQIRFVGGCASAAFEDDAHAPIWVNGEVVRDGGAVVLLASALPFQAISSCHLIPTELKTVVTAASGRLIQELDGKPAALRARELIEGLGDRVAEPIPHHTFARMVDGMPYVRAMTFVNDGVMLAGSIPEAGHVLRIMRPGDLIGTTQRDLAAARDKVGGQVAALLAFSCLGRYNEAASYGTERALAGVYGETGAFGLHTFGEQSGMLLVHDTLTGLAIGARRV
ncbi:MAG TPA: FIST N-terminal domain-containing protein [Kofleriaceae bacterium]